MAVPAFVDELPFWQLPDRETAQDEGPRAKAQVLFALFAVPANQRDAFDLSQLPLRYDEIRLCPLQDRTGGFEISFLSCTRLAYTSKECTFQRSPRVNAGPDPAPQVERKNRAATEVAGCHLARYCTYCDNELSSQIGRKTMHADDQDEHH